MLFYGVCDLCNGGVRVVRDNDRSRRIRIEALQSESGRKLLQISGRLSDDISSVVLVEKYRLYIKSDAIREIMEYIDFPPACTRVKDSTTRHNRARYKETRRIRSRQRLAPVAEDRGHINFTM